MLLEVRFNARLKIRLRKPNIVNLREDLVRLQEIHLDPEIETQEETVEEVVAAEVAFHHEEEVEAAPEEDPYLAKDAAGRRVKRIPDIAKYLEEEK